MKACYSSPPVTDSVASDGVDTIGGFNIWRTCDIIWVSVNTGHSDFTYWDRAHREHGRGSLHIFFLFPGIDRIDGVRITGASRVCR